MTICSACNACHWLNKWPMMEVLPHGNSSLGRPMRTESPAPRMITPSAGRYWLDFFTGKFGTLLDVLSHDAHGDLWRALRADVHADRAGDLIHFFGAGDALPHELFA